MTITAGIHTFGEAHNSPSVTSPAKNTQPTGSLLVAVNVGQTVVGISDSDANTWVVGASQNFNGTNGITHFWYVQNAAGGTGQTFTGSQTGGAGPQFLIGEFLGCALSGGPNASNFTELSGSVAAVTGPAVTPTVDGCLIVTVMVGDNFPALVTPTSANGTVTDAFATNGNGIAGAMSWFVAGAKNVPYSDTLTFAGQTAYDFACYTFAFAPGGGVISAARNLSAGGPGVMPGSLNQFRAAPRATSSVPSFFWVATAGAIASVTAALTTGARTGGQGFVSQPGPGVGPFSNSQFTAAPRAVTSAPQSFLMAAQAGSIASLSGSLAQLQLFAAQASSIASVTAALSTVRSSGGIGYLTQPGPGVGPFSNNQFLSAPRSTNQPFQQLVGGVLAGGQATVTANLVTGISLAAKPGAVASTAPALSTGISLAANLGAQASTSLLLTTSISLAVSAGAIASASPALLTGITLAANVSGLSYVSAALGSGAQFTATAAGLAGISAALLTSIQIAATPAGNASVSATLSTAVTLAVQAAGNASVNAGLSASILFAAQLSGQGSVTPALTAAILFAASPQGLASVTAGLSLGQQQLAAVASGGASVTATLVTQINLAATPQGIASGIVSLTTGIRLQALASAVATASATLPRPPPNLSGSPNLVESDYEQRTVVRN